MSCTRCAPPPRPTHVPPPTSHLPPTTSHLPPPMRFTFPPRLCQTGVQLSSASNVYVPVCYTLFHNGRQFSTKMLFIYCIHYIIMLYTHCCVCCRRHLVMRSCWTPSVHASPRLNCSSASRLSRRDSPRRLASRLALDSTRPSNNSTR